MWNVTDNLVPDWAEVEEGEVPLGFVDDDAGLQVFKVVLEHAKLPLVEASWRQALIAQSQREKRMGKKKRKEKRCSSDHNDNPVLRTFRQLVQLTGDDETLLSKPGDSTSKKWTPDQGKSPGTPTLNTFTQYKPASRKVKPVDNAPSDGSAPKGDTNWKKKRLEAAKLRARYGHRWDQYILPSFSTITTGSRLTTERLQTILNKATTLTPKEKEVLAYVLQCREAALAWDFSECGKIDPEIVPPQEIKTVPHKAWQSRSVPIPKPLTEKVIALLQERWQRGILEESHAAYRNNWFLVMKKNGGLRLINDAQKINGVTLRDAFIPPGGEEFSEEFGGCLLLSLLDLFSGYDQVELDPLSRDLTTFATPIGLFRMCTLPQGATNSVAQFMRAITRILQDLIPHVCRPFLDDICIKGPRHDYQGKEFEEGIRLFVWEHILNVDAVLLNCELAGATIAAAKSQWCQEEAVLLGYLCCPGGRAPDKEKVTKITEWTLCNQVSDVRAFLGIVGFYRVWVKDYGIIARPLFDLTKKDKSWEWTENEQWAMEFLQYRITTAPILATLVFNDPRYGQVYLMVDASLFGWGAVIEQVGPDSKRHPCRFESGVWNKAEMRYDATKRELRGLLYALKRTRRYLFGVHFIVETDAMVLVHQLNGAASDVPGALLMRWIAWIQLFDFTIKHIPGSKNSVADGLSRKPAGPSDLREKETEEDIDDFVDAQIYMQQLEDAGFVLKGRWSDESHRIANYLTTLTEPTHLSSAAMIRAFKIRAMKYLVRDGALWMRPKKPGLQPRRLVDFPEDRAELFEEYHRKTGHKGRDDTYHRISTSYYWKGMYEDIKKWIRACEKCQFWDPRRFEEPAQYTIPSAIPFARWSLDIQYLAERRGVNLYCIEARDDLSGYPEARVTRIRSAQRIMDFIEDHILWKWGWPLSVTVDGGSEFKKEVIEGLKERRIQRVTISSYNSRANGQNENGHFRIASALAKFDLNCKGGLDRKVQAVLMAERTTLKASHGMTPFYLSHGFDPISPIELDLPSWRIARWDDVPVITPQSSRRERERATEALITIRTEILMGCQGRHQEAAAKVAAARKKWSEQRNKALKHKMRPASDPIRVNDLVLVYDEARRIDKSTFRKLQWRWKGPYRVREIAPKRVYLLSTLDGCPIDGSFPPKRVKRFFQLDGVMVAEDDSKMQPDDPHPLDSSDHKGTDPSLPEKLVVIEKELRETVPGRAEEFTHGRPKTRSEAAKERRYGKLVVELHKGKPPGWEEGPPREELRNEVETELSEESRTSQEDEKDDTFVG